MIDHVSISVRDLNAAAEFYDEVLAPLGLMRLVNRDDAVGYGKRYPEFWLNRRPDVLPIQNPGAHICLRASGESAVKAFHETALKRGAANEGAPGPRRAAMTTYFGAFIIDQDGNKLEAVTFPPPSD